MTTHHTTYQERAYTSKEGYAKLDRVLWMSKELYNAALEEWQSAYSCHVGRKHLLDHDTGKLVRKRDDSDWVYVERREPRSDAKSISLYDQTKSLTQIRAEDPGGWGALDVQVGRGVLHRLDRARNAFFRRVKAGETPGYPRFKSGRRWKCLEIRQPRPAMVRNDRVKIKGLPTLRLKPHRPLPPSESLKSLRIVRKGRRTFVDLVYEVRAVGSPLALGPEIHAITCLLYTSPSPRDS